MKMGQDPVQINLYLLFVLEPTKIQKGMPKGEKLWIMDRMKMQTKEERGVGARLVHMKTPDCSCPQRCKLLLRDPNGRAGM